MPDDYSDSPDNIRNDRDRDRDYDKERDRDQENPFRQPLHPSYELTPDDKQMAMFAHLGGIIGGFLVPLIIWMIKKDTSRFVDDQGKEALNFQLTLLIGYVIASGLTFATCGVGFPLVFVPVIIGIVYSCIAAGAVNRGELYRYPSWCCIRMIK